ncbi:MAG: hypothetical protein AAF664_10230 [Planctomycetota bacterium]
MKLRYTIRMTMLVTLIASIGFGFYVYQDHIHQRRLHAMMQIERDAGFVTFRNRFSGIPIEVTDDVRRNDRLDAIYLAGSNLEQKTLDLLPSLNEARFISFNGSAFADHHVGSLDQLTNLRELQLNGTLITEVGLAHLSREHRLTLLTLNDTSVDDLAIKALAAMTSLQRLYLHNTHFSDEGLIRLQSDLPGCSIVR